MTSTGSMIALPYRIILNVFKNLQPGECLLMDSAILKTFKLYKNNFYEEVIKNHANLQNPKNLHNHQIVAV